VQPHPLTHPIEQPIPEYQIFIALKMLSEIPLLLKEKRNFIMVPKEQ
jgi:hypothetical protein